MKYLPIILLLIAFARSETKETTAFCFIAGAIILSLYMDSKNDNT